MTSRKVQARPTKRKPYRVAVAESFSVDELFRSAIFHARDDAQTLTQIRECYDGARVALLEAIFRAQKAVA